MNMYFLINMYINIQRPWNERTDPFEDRVHRGAKNRSRSRSKSKGRRRGGSAEWVRRGSIDTHSSSDDNPLSVGEEEEASNDVEVIENIIDTDDYGRFALRTNTSPRGRTASPARFVQKRTISHVLST